MANFKTLVVPLSGSWQNLKTVNDGVDVSCQVLIFSPDPAGSYVVQISPAGLAIPAMHVTSATANVPDGIVILNPANGARFSDFDVFGGSGKNLYVSYQNI